MESHAPGTLSYRAHMAIPAQCRREASRAVSSTSVLGSILDYVIDVQTSSCTAGTACVT
jgi:hypothetical protein